MATASPKSIRALRREIDDLDRWIVRLLAERSEKAEAIVRIRREAGGPTKDDRRALRVVARAVELFRTFRGRYSDRTIATVYNALIDGAEDFE